MCKHGVPKKIVTDRGSIFTSVFWRHLQQALGSRLDFSTTFHRQTGGQTERTNQILEDMLRACALDFGGSWNEHLPLAEFSYNNSYQSSIKMPTIWSTIWKKVSITYLLVWDWREQGIWTRLHQRSVENHRYHQRQIENSTEQTEKLWRSEM